MNTIRTLPTAGTDERAIDRLLAQYAESHRHPRNEAIHCLCVPAIVWSVLAVLWAAHPLVAVAFSAAALVYYFRLSAVFGIGMLVISVVILVSLALLTMVAPARILPLAIGVFVVAWIGQFIGHRIEGKKPSFFDDLRFLLIGPLFVLGVLYRQLHVRY